MSFISNIPPLIWAFTGFLVGALAMRLLSGKDKNLIRQLSTGQAVLEEKLKQFQNREAEFKQLQQLFIETKTHNAELQTRIDEQAKNTEEKLKLLLDAEVRLNTQFENLAGKIFDDRSKQFTEHHKTSLDHIVSPLREQLGEFKQRIETVYDNENKDRISLREEIVSLRRDTAQMNQEALNLTRALKGDKKAQGNWGEMILEKVLEKSGLRKGIEYETQGAFRDEDNRLFKPDVIVRLPENKDVVIDSKVSLLAYERYCSTEDDQERTLSLKQHTDAVREHIKGLSNKNYSDLKGLRSLDFVLLFMPIEAAFIAAFQADERLFTDAFEHKIVVVTPTTLLATLRTIENIWRYERQNENARAIADKAGLVYDKIRGFVDDLDKLGKQLSTVNSTYDGVMNKLTQGNGNLIRQAGSFVELGVKVKKAFPKSITDQAGLDNDEN
ncbi:DNA recombination protein RmuC [Candidatus Methylobacter oryzae]|uniref:DNA recombination protein RmuC n=1 Tax=Candidatus Methylobacter oryzae TaxID=2497749 RepID=A0ABY3CC14_9GAMM|nr:DNA recombination protein RmuC [Candidatus Methylobacter oryzae]TRW95569.1 DNA recombination protein RmuC [Candidatus Methylobacter oryzae]